MNYIKHPVVNDPVYGLNRMDEKIIREHTDSKEEYEKYREFGRIYEGLRFRAVYPSW